MQLLADVWPATLSFADLLDAARKLSPEDATAENLGDLLMATYATGVIELHAAPARCVCRVSARPVASPLARSQASRGRLITTTRHTTIQAADANMRLLVRLLDGKHDVASLARQLAPELNVQEDVLAKGIQEKLASLARAGLLVGLRSSEVAISITLAARDTIDHYSFYSVKLSIIPLS